jgi:hypothetical protein
MGWRSFPIGYRQNCGVQLISDTLRMSIRGMGLLLFGSYQPGFSCHRSVDSAATIMVQWCRLHVTKHMYICMGMHECIVHGHA